MISIDADLKRAAAGLARWSAHAAQAMAGSFAGSPSAKIDWDDGAGEGWLRILNDREAVALISVKLPLVIIKGPASTVADAPTEVVTVHVDDLDEAELTASLETLTGTFGSPDRFHALDPDGFSANDLWYATV